MEPKSNNHGRFLELPAPSAQAFSSSVTLRALRNGRVVLAYIWREIDGSGVQGVKHAAAQPQKGEDYSR